MNPFRCLRQTTERRDGAVIVATFLSTLLLESRETVISKELQAESRDRRSRLSETDRKCPSLTDFLEQQADVPAALSWSVSASGAFSRTCCGIGVMRI